MRSILTVLSVVYFLSASAQTSTKGFKHINGVEYKIIKDVPGPTAKMGEIIEFNIVAKVDTLVLGDSRKQQNGKPAAGKVEATKGPGEFQAIFPYLSAGDSAIIYISCDTLLAAMEKAQKPNQQLPPWMKKGNKIFVTISVVAIKPMEEYQKEMQAEQAKMQKEMSEKEEKQKPIDNKKLLDYLTKNNIKAEKTPSGLYYQITKEGTGDKAKAGQHVSVNYLGKTLAGKQFDANVDENFHQVDGKQAFTFTLGQGQVIKGWDEGIPFLNKGSRAILYIPSYLAYGAQSPSPAIGPNEILVFNVEIIDIN